MIPSPTALLFLSALLSLALLGQDAPPAAAKAEPAPQKEAPAPAEAVNKLIDATIPDVVATYGDGKTVQGAELRTTLKMIFRMNPEETMTAENIKAIAHSLAEREIDQALQAAAAAKEGILPDLEAAKKQVAEIMAGEPKLREMIKAGELTEAKLVQEIATSLVVQKWIETKLAPAAMTAEEIQKYYDEHLDDLASRRIAQILVMPKKDPKTGEVTAAAREEAKKRIAGIQARLQAGEAFGKLARECSDCPSGKKDGDLGRHTKNGSPFPPEFNDAAFALKDNETSGIVETYYGYHLVRVTEVPATMTPEVRTQIVQEQSGEKVFQLVQEKSEALKKAANVKFNL